jgi:hypothetical protein
MEVSFSRFKTRWDAQLNLFRYDGLSLEALRPLLGIVSTRVNGQFSISSCLILLASQMGRETLSSLKSLFFERIS